MKEQRFKAASVGPKLFPHNFAEQDNSHIIIYLPQREKGMNSQKFRYSLLHKEVRGRITPVIYKRKTQLNLF